MHIKQKSTDRKINISHILPSLGYGGAEKLVSYIAKYLNKSKFSINIICIFEGGPVVSEIEKYGVKVYILDTNLKKFSNILSFIYNSFKLIIKLSLLLRKLKTDIIHTHLHGASELCGFISGKLVCVKVIISTCHNINGWFTKYYYLKKNLLKFVVNHSQMLIAVSRTVADAFKKQIKINPNKLIIIKNGIDLESKVSWEGAKRNIPELKIPADHKIMTTVASLTPQKGHIYMIRAIPFIIKYYPKIRYLIVGDGILKNTLINEAKRLKIDKYIIFAGIRKDIDRILQITDIFVMPSLWEGLPLALLEAMANSVPVVATSISSFESIVVHGFTGILVPPRDSLSLANAIVNLIEDQKKATKIAKKAMSIIKTNYDAKHMVHLLEKLYCELFFK